MDEGESPAKVFRRIKNLREHVKTAHPDFRRSELDAYLPVQRQPIIFKPQPCPYPGCKNTKFMATRLELIAHGHNAHKISSDVLEPYILVNPPHYDVPSPAIKYGEWVHQHCRVPRCMSLTVFKTKHAYQKHARLYHQIQGNDLAPYIDTPQVEKRARKVKK